MKHFPATRSRRFIFALRNISDAVCFTRARAKVPGCARPLRFEHKDKNYLVNSERFLGTPRKCCKAAFDGRIRVLVSLGASPLSGARPDATGKKVIAVFHLVCIVLEALKHNHPIF